MVKKYLITGANRGIGLGLTHVLLDKGHDVVATCRDPGKAQALKDLQEKKPDQLRIHPLDVTDETSILDAAHKMEGLESLDVLINNAAMVDEYFLNLDRLSTNVVLEHLKVNVIGAMRVTRAMLKLLHQAEQPKIINMSSNMGSIQDNTSGSSYGYRMSKAALNMFNKSLSIEYPNIICVVTHPGWVKTRMGGENALIEVAESTQGLVQVIENLKTKDSGKFFNFRGDEIPW